MFSIGNDELEQKPALQEYEKCPDCGKLHKVVFGTNKQGKEDKSLSFVKCGDITYLVGIQNKRV